MSWLNDPAMTTLAGALDGLVTRQGLISSNLTNIDTPGYQPKSIDFETALRRQLDAMESGTTGSAQAPMDGPAANVAMRTTDPRQSTVGGAGSTGSSDAAGLGGATESTFNGSIRNDGNTVDLESEMTALTETQIQFEAVTRLMTNKLTQFTEVLTGAH